MKFTELRVGLKIYWREWHPAWGIIAHLDHNTRAVHVRWNGSSIATGPYIDLYRQWVSAETGLDVMLELL